MWSKSALSAITLFLIAAYTSKSAASGNLSILNRPWPGNGITPLYIGSVFEQGDDTVMKAFVKGIDMLNKNPTYKNWIKIEADVNIINTADVFKLSGMICTQFAIGAFAMVGAVPSESFDTLHSYTNAFQVPFLTPWFPEKVLPPTSRSVDHAISLTPDYHKAVSDTITYYGWKSIIYFYDSHEGLLRLQELYLDIKPGKATFQISYVKQIYNVSDAISYLRSLEGQNRWSNKYVVLDTKTKLAKDVIIAHVRDAKLGRRNYHYLLSGLVMDEKWDKHVLEFNSVNITGFSLVDYNKSIVQNFISFLKANNVDNDTISARSALTFDALQVISRAFVEFQHKKPDVIYNTIRRMQLQNYSNFMECNPSESRTQTPFEHGSKLLKLLKKTNVEGLTGPIKFNEAGNRYNFTLNIVEMTTDNNMTLVARWSDLHGLTPVVKKAPPLSVASKYERNRTYVATSILKAPYLIKSTQNEEDSFIGFCKEFMEIISEKLEIKYEIRIVPDGKVGSENPEADHGWDGLIGEVVRKEADMAIGPIEVTVERERAVDFSKPFITVDFILPKKAILRNPPQSFGFLMPFSNNILISVTFTYFIVSFVLYIVTRISPKEWRIESTNDKNDDNGTTKNKITNNFTLGNCFWFIIGASLQRQTGTMPLCLGGRVIVIVWWMYSFFLISFYIASLSSFLIVDNVSKVTPMKAIGSHEYIFGMQMQDVLATTPIYAIEHDFSQNHNWMNNIVQTIDNGLEMCDQMITIWNDDLKEYAVAFPKGSALREGVNIVIQSMKNSGELQNLIRKWFLKNDCNIHNKIDNEVTLYQMSGLFYALFVGILGAICIAILDRLLRRTWVNNKPKRGKSRLELETVNESSPSHSLANEEEQVDWEIAPCPAFYGPANADENDIVYPAAFSQA